jgi:hypothetical protein
MRPDELIGFLRPRIVIEHGPWWSQPLILELVFWLLVVLVTLILLRVRPRILDRIERLGTRLGRQRGMALVIVACSAWAMRALLLPLLPIPEPIVHDEYSLLFQAQTFASGKLTNPTPAMWVHFETFHVNMWPTYQSMYPPAQALPMAAALALHLPAWWGVWWSVGLMCAAICWMLQAWMPPHWAFLGGLLCVMRFAAFSYWINSYWGGAVAALAGALVLGALPRIKHSFRVRDLMLLALGLAILANSRMYEGLVFSLPAVVAIVLWLLGVGRKKKIRIIACAPALGLLIATGGAMAYYNWRSTGNPLRMPYQVNEEQYHITKPFIWQKRRPIPDYHHQIMRTRYVRHELPDYLRRNYSDGLRLIYMMKFQVLYDFFFWPFLGLSYFALRTMVRSRRAWMIPVTFFALAAGLMIEQWPPNAHYAAPIECAMLAITLYGLRLLRAATRGKPVLGRAIVQAIVLVFCCCCLGALIGEAWDPYHMRFLLEMPATLDRSRLRAELEAMPGEHLVIVHNRRSSLGLYDWVYNMPDIDHAKIIWARDMEMGGNAELLRFYPNRHAWFVDQDDGVMRLTPYPNQDPQLLSLRSTAIDAAAEPLNVHR